MTIRVLVADDQSMVRAGFRVLLGREEDIEVVAEASNGLEAVQKAAQFNPSVVLMDIRMPELDGLQATERILAANSAARILILTTFDLDEYVFKALRAGASGFVLKDDSPEQLIAAVRTVASGEALLSPAVTTRVIKKFVRTPHPDPPTEFEELSERERDVFRLMVDGRSNAEIAKELYISEATVKTHVTHVLQKLKVRDRVQAVVLAYQTGLIESDALGSGRWRELSGAAKAGRAPRHPRLNPSRARNTGPSAWVRSVPGASHARMLLDSQTTRVASRDIPEHWDRRDLPRSSQSQRRAGAWAGPKTGRLARCPRLLLEESGSGLAPAGDGWFVVNVRDAEWMTSENGVGVRVSELREPEARVPSVRHPT